MKTPTIVVHAERSRLVVFDRLRRHRRNMEKILVENIKTRTDVGCRNGMISPQNNLLLYSSSRLTLSSKNHLAFGLSGQNAQSTDRPRPQIVFCVYCI